MYTDVLDPGGQVIRTETGDTRADYTILAYEPPYDDAYAVAYNEEAEKYYYTDPQGRPVSEPLFDNCTGICGGHAVVEVKNKLYLLTVIPE